MSDFKYEGSELDLFADVHNWKSYWSQQIRTFITGDVVEVGAGIGSNTPFLDSGGKGRWVCLEPDSRLFLQLTGNLSKVTNRRGYETVCGTLPSLDPSQTFDTIIYIDVLEHIQDDQNELAIAACYLNAGGRIIILSPAHNWLFTPFDTAIGHFRRYNRSMLRSISPKHLTLEQVFYLDSVGLLLSTANKLFLKQSMPTKAQLRFWDGCIIPVSRFLDRCFFNKFGKSIVAIWRREIDECP